MTKGTTIACFLFVVLLCGATCNAQRSAESSEPNPRATAHKDSRSSIDTTHCLAIGADDVHLKPLAAVCNFALSYRGNLPDFICEQTTVSSGMYLSTVLKAEVTFEQGHETYSKVYVDGKSSDLGSLAATGNLRFISQGELGSDLVDLFRPPIVTEFHFLRQERLHKAMSSVFEIRIAVEKNTFWELLDRRGVSLHPAFAGKLWIAPEKGYPLQLQLSPVNLPQDFGFSRASVTIEYRDISINGLGSFRLPFKSEANMCGRRGTPFVCRKNVTVFHDCRKFAAKSRIVGIQPQ
jgi:hypothetical protein